MKQIIKSCLKSVIASCKRYSVDFDALVSELWADEVLKRGKR
jgi:hypothetical protein